MWKESRQRGTILVAMALTAQLVMTDPPPQLTEQIDWLRDFEARNGRKLRVLHVGNVNNNAYLAAKFLRRVGVNADVLCPNYYHIMATPEWEELISSTTGMTTTGPASHVKISATTGGRIGLSRGR